MIYLYVEIEVCRGNAKWSQVKSFMFQKKIQYCDVGYTIFIPLIYGLDVWLGVEVGVGSSGQEINV